MFLLLSAVCASLFLSQAEASPVPSSHVTCRQAVQYYERYKRIYAIANGKDIVPIYGMLPASEWRKLRCMGRNSGRHSYWVKTLDNRNCAVAVYCG